MGKNTEWEEKNTMGKLIDNIILVDIQCEHCGELQNHDELGKHGACKSCGKKIVKGLF